MKLYAFAAFLALSLVGLAAEAAKADQPCCGSSQYQHTSLISHKFRVVKHATVFGCDGYHCQTNVILKHGITIRARCRNGWCELIGIPMKNVWVLESCLYRGGYSSHGIRGDEEIDIEDGDEEEGFEEEEEGDDEE
jgi:hypothetical protein